jgi:hypothetical protein
MRNRSMRFALEPHEKAGRFCRHQGWIILALASHGYLQWGNTVSGDPMLVSSLVQRSW